MSDKALAPTTPLPRRAVLRGGGALALATALGPIGCAGGPQPDRGTVTGGAFADDPFGLGVASGDPLPDRVVLWTRLAPRPLEADGGMDEAPVRVRWQMAADENFRRVVREGVVLAEAGHAHSVHVDVGGLEPARGYFYRFIAGGVASTVGRTRTAPVPGSMPARLRLASVGCQNYEAGFFTAYRHLAGEDFDLVIHTGDYIYEGAAAKNRKKLVRSHPDHVCRTLADYRMRYGLYKSDADLKAAHAAHPFAVVFDDHEVANNWAGRFDGRGRSDADFFARRAAGFKAWWEHMPVRAAAMPAGSTIRIHRGLDFGALARINLCDTRQYRTPQPCGGGTVARCAGDSAADAQMLGVAQEAWLNSRLLHSGANWNVIAQQVVMAELNRATDDGGVTYDMDKWDGYRAARTRLIGLLASAPVANPIVLSGDIHRHIAAELRTDFARPETPAVATEFVNTSISSRGNGNAQARAPAAWLAHNPHIRYARDLRGYICHSVTRQNWRADFRVIDRVTLRGEPIRTDRSFVVETGHPGLSAA